MSQPPLKISNLIGSLEKIRGYYGDLDVRLLSETGPQLGSVKVGIDSDEKTFEKSMYVILSDELRPSSDRN